MFATLVVTGLIQVIYIINIKKYSLVRVARNWLAHRLPPLENVKASAPLCSKRQHASFTSMAHHLIFWHSVLSWIVGLRSRNDDTSRLAARPINETHPPPCVTRKDEPKNMEIRSHQRQVLFCHRLHMSSSSEFLVVQCYRGQRLLRYQPD